MTRDNLEDISNLDQEITQQLPLNIRDMLYKNHCLYGVKTDLHMLKRYILSYQNKYCLIDPQMLWNNIQTLIALLKKLKRDDILVFLYREPHNSIIRKFAKLLGFKVFDKKFVPGIFTNTRAKNYIRPRCIFVFHDKIHKRIIKEASYNKICVVGCNNLVKSRARYNRCIYINNFYRDSIGYVLYLIYSLLEKGNNLLSFEEFKESVN